MRTRIGQIDLDTGEVLDGIVAYVPVPKRNGFKRFLTMGQEGLLWLSRHEMGELASNRKLNGTDYVVLLCLLAHVDYENYILVPQSKMAEIVNMDRSRFNRSVRKLVELGIFDKGEKMGRTMSLRLNPNFGWKGSAKNHVIELEPERKKRPKK
jgi:hypothetical protein